MISSIPIMVKVPCRKLQKVESIVMSFPLQVRLKSDRIKNFKVYTLAGVKFDYDLASNKGTTNSENLLKVNKTDWGVEAGLVSSFSTNM